MVNEAKIKEVFEPTAPAPGTVFAEKYEVEKLLGKGSLGVVFAAINLYTNRRVAIKLINTELTAYAGATDRLLREAQITGTVKHDNIVDIYDVSISEGKVFLVMEYLQGQSLNTWIKAQARTPSEVLHPIMQAMRGIEAAHNAGVVHRDLKPDNIFVCCDDKGYQVNTKVLDFGVSKFVYRVPDIEEANITQAGLMVGTPNYMPPEQIQDPRYVDHRADIYALGIILYEIFAGKIPFTSTSFGDLLIEIMQKGVPSLAKFRPELPKELIAAIDKAVARDREQRFASVKEFIAALEPVVRIFDNDVSHVRAVVGARPLPAERTTSQDGFQRLRETVDQWAESIKQRRLLTRRLLIAVGIVIIGTIVYFGMRDNPKSAAGEGGPGAKPPAAANAKTVPEQPAAQRTLVEKQPAAAVRAAPSKTATRARHAAPAGASDKTAVSIDALTGSAASRKAKAGQAVKEKDPDADNTEIYVVGDWKKPAVVDFKGAIEGDAFSANIGTSRDKSNGESAKAKKRSVRVKSDEF